MRSLASLKGLRVLELHGTKLTDAGLAYLTQLPLDWLGLSDTGVTDRGVARLCELRSLSGLNIIGTQITREGAARLRKSLPKLPRPFSRYDYEVDDPKSGRIVEP
jgi:hypothetical protein